MNLTLRTREAADSGNLKTVILGRNVSTCRLDCFEYSEIDFMNSKGAQKFRKYQPINAENKQSYVRKNYLFIPFLTLIGN